jgi:hypothetical protein
MDARSGWRHLGVAVLGGAALGATVMTRIDGVAYLIFLPLLAAIGWLARPAERRHLLRTYAAVLVGLIPPVVIGTLDVQRHSASYYAALRHDVLSLWAAFVAMAVVGGALVVVWPRSRALRDLAARYRSRAATVAASIAAIGLVLAWAIRPAIQKLRWPSGINSLPYLSLNRQLQHQENLGLDGLRTYGERSVEWLSWYLGPFVLALATVGLAFLLARLIREPSVAVAITLLVAGSLSAEYLWNPNVNGDQPWAMRRFVPAVLPLCALLAAAALEWLWRFVTRVRPQLGTRVLGVVAVIVLLVFPIGHALPVRALTVEEHFPEAVRATCDGLGADAAVLVVGQGFDTVYVQTLRDWCNVPVVGLDAPVGAPTLQALSRSWHTQGRRLWLVSSTPALLHGLALPPKELGSANSLREIELTLSRIPQQYVSKAVAFWAAPVTSS